MTRFTQAPGDDELLAELKEAGILGPDVLERIDAALGRPESVSLDEALLAGAGAVADNLWLSWLIRRHGCHRYGRVAWCDEAADWARQGPPVDGNLAYRRASEGSPMVAVLRPDRLRATAGRFPGMNPLWAAATLAELREIKAAHDRVCISPNV